MTPRWPELEVKVLREATVDHHRGEVILAQENAVALRAESIAPNGKRMVALYLCGPNSANVADEEWQGHGRQIVRPALEKLLRESTP